MCLPTFLKVKKCPLGGLERKCPFCGCKDSVKDISNVIGTPYFQEIFVRLVNDIKSFDFDHNYTKVIPRPVALIFSIIG
jgi:hypothetical protein